MTTDNIPPVGRSWPQLYAIVLGALMVEILFFYGLMAWLA